MEGRIKKRQETVDHIPGPKMKPSACIAVKNDITVVRSFSQVAAEQYERRATTSATKSRVCFTNNLALSDSNNYYNNCSENIPMMNTIPMVLKG